MTTPRPTTRTGFTNEFNKPISDDVDKWFAYGVKTSEPQVQRGFCSTKTTLYVVLGVVGFIILAVVIMVPIIIGNINKSSNG